MSDLVGNPEDRFSRVAAHIVRRLVSHTDSNKQISQQLQMHSSVSVLNVLLPF